MKPSVDYLMQYPVESIRRSKKGDGYLIRFEGGAGIEVETEEDSPNLEGLTLVKSDHGEDTVTLTFGRATPQGVKSTVTLELERGKYKIEDDKYSTGESSVPREDAEDEEDDSLPPDPSPERVVDGPERVEDDSEEG